MQQIKIKLYGNELVVSRDQYCMAKAKQMVEFGYAGITAGHVDKQIVAVLARQKFGDGLDIIGKFMEGEVLAVVDEVDGIKL